MSRRVQLQNPYMVGPRPLSVEPLLVGPLLVGPLLVGPLLVGPLLVGPLLVGPLFFLIYMTICVVPLGTSLDKLAAVFTNIQDQ